MKKPRGLETLKSVLMVLNDEDLQKNKHINKETLNEDLFADTTFNFLLIFTGIYL
jgi:hypothetical protein